MDAIHKLFLDKKHPTDVNDYYHVFNETNILNVIYWNDLMQLVADVPGDIVECGVGRGRSLITLNTLNKFMRLKNNDYPNRKIIGLDSFEGFPSPSKEDVSYRKKFAGEWKSSPNHEFDYTISNLEQVMRNAGVNNDDGHVNHFIKGFFEDTTKNMDIETIAILHLDGDLYSSVKDPLLNLSDKVSKHGLIVVDDYVVASEEDAWPGARKAIEEFLEITNDFIMKISLKGSPYLVRVK